jgi:hypothetical protein
MTAMYTLLGMIVQLYVLNKILLKEKSVVQPKDSLR